MLFAPKSSENEKGQGLFEYAMIVLVVIVIVIILLAFFGPKIQAMFEEILKGLQQGGL